MTLYSIDIHFRWNYKLINDYIKYYIHSSFIIKIFNIFYVNICYLSEPQMYHTDHYKFPIIKHKTSCHIQCDCNVVISA